MFCILAVLVLSGNSDAFRLSRRKNEIGSHRRANYTITTHKRIAKEAAQELLAQNPSLRLMFGDFAEHLAGGTAWPDCPVMLFDGADRLSLEMDSSYNSCSWVPGAGEVGFHEGFAEMAGQTVKQNIPFLGYMRIKERMGNNRMITQHQHASPLPTTHLVWEDGLCDEECRQTFREQCINSVIDSKYHFCDLPPFAQRFMGSDFLWPQIHATPHSVSTNLQVRNKILEQSGKWYCKAIQHSTTAALLRQDYRWKREVIRNSEEFADKLHKFGYPAHLIEDINITVDEPTNPESHWMADSVHVLSRAEFWGGQYEFKNGTLSSDIDDLAFFWHNERHLGVHYLGRILHILQDSFSESHTQRIMGAGDVTYITQFYSMDDVDWVKHGSYDKKDNAMTQAAKVATSSILQEFGRWFDVLQSKLGSATYSSSIIDEIGGAAFFNNGLRRFLNEMCGHLKVDPADLGEPAGGSSKIVSLTGESWKPEAMPEKFAEEYRRHHLVYDYPPPDADICTSLEVLDPDRHPETTYHRPSKTPALPRGVLGGDGLGVGRDVDIDLTCRGLGASSTITLDEVVNKESLHFEDWGEVKLKKKSLAWWKLYSE